MAREKNTTWVRPTKARLVERAAFVAGRAQYAFKQGSGGSETFAATPPRTRRISLSELSYASPEHALFRKLGLPEYNPDELAAQKGGLSIYDKMREDDIIKAILTAMKMFRLSTPWKIVAASEKPEDVQWKEEVDWQLRHMQSTLKKSLLGLYSALDYGFVDAELVIDRQMTPYGERIVLRRIASRKPHNFSFATDGHGNLLPDGIIQSVGGKDIRLPVERMIHYPFNSEWDNPYGRSFLRSAYRSWFAKDWLIQFWNKGLERYAGGTPIGTLPETSTDPKTDMALMQDVFEGWQNGSYIILPNGFKVELAEMAGGGLSAYKDAIQTHSGMIASSLLFPNRLGFVDFDGGSYNLAEVQGRLWIAVIDDLGEDTRDTIMGEQVIKRIVDWNAVTPPNEYPRFEMEPLSLEGKYQFSEMVMKAIRAGALSWTVDDEVEFRKRYGLPVLPEDVKQMLVRRQIFIANKTADGTNDDSGPTDTGDGTKVAPRGGSGASSGGSGPVAASSGGGKGTVTVPAETMSGLVAAPREFTRFEDSIEWGERKSKWDEMDVFGADMVRDVGKKMKASVLKWAKPVYGSKDHAAVKKFRPPFMLDFERSVLAFTGAGWLRGKIDGLEEVNAQLDDDKQVVFAETFATQADFDMAFDSLNQRVRDALTGLVPMMASEVTTLRKHALWVKGIEEERIIAEVQFILDNAIEYGTWNDAKEQLTHLFNQYIEKENPTLGAPGTASEKAWSNVGARAEVVARTNLSWAYNAGRMAMFEHPDVADIVKFYQWSSVLDERTTDYCDEMDGQIFAKDDFEKPPAHHNCRSMVVPVVRTDWILPNQRRFLGKPFPTEIKRLDGTMAARGMGF